MRDEVTLRLSIPKRPHFLKRLFDKIPGPPWLKRAAIFGGLTATSVQLKEYLVAEAFLIVGLFCCIAQVYVWTVPLKRPFGRWIARIGLAIVTISLFIVFGLTVAKMRGPEPWSVWLRDKAIVTMPPVSQPSTSQATSPSSLPSSSGSPAASPPQTPKPSVSPTKDEQLTSSFPSLSPTPTNPQFRRFLGDFKALHKGYKTYSVVASADNNIVEYYARLVTFTSQETRLEIYVLRWYSARDVMLSVADGYDRIVQDLKDRMKEEGVEIPGLVVSRTIFLYVDAPSSTIGHLGGLRETENKGFSFIIEGRIN